MGIIASLLKGRSHELTADAALEKLNEYLEGHKETGLSFAAICRELHLPRRKLDRYIRSELGCSGQELVSAVTRPREDGDYSASR